MKRLILSAPGPATRIALSVFIAACLLMPPASLAWHSADALPVADTAASDDCEVRAILLMEAMDAVGVEAPVEAAEVWGQGLMARSAALQYAVMSRTLRDKYARQLEETAPNWVTGVSSPWIDSFRIVQVRKTGLRTREVTMCFATATSAGPGQEFEAVLSLAQEDGFYRITGIRMDEGLYPYTGFQYTM